MDDSGIRGRFIYEIIPYIAKLLKMDESYIHEVFFNLTVTMVDDDSFIFDFIFRLLQCQTEETDYKILREGFQEIFSRLNQAVEIGTLPEVSLLSDFVVFLFYPIVSVLYKQLPLVNSIKVNILPNNKFVIYFGYVATQKLLSMYRAIMTEVPAQELIRANKLTFKYYDRFNQIVTDFDGRLDYANSNSKDF